jgi:hypothetical protein
VGQVFGARNLTPETSHLQDDEASETEILGMK